MFDQALLVELLNQILEAATRIERRSSGIQSAEEFEATPEGLDNLDGICMMLIAIGENLKRFDAKTEGKLLANIPRSLGRA